MDLMPKGQLDDASTWRTILSEKDAGWSRVARGLVSAQALNLDEQGTVDAVAQAKATTSLIDGSMKIAEQRLWEQARAEKEQEASDVQGKRKRAASGKAVNKYKKKKN